MLHIILLLLKIIGWILLVILGVLILLLLVVLFGSLKYQLQGAAAGSIDSINGKVTFSWFFKTIRGFVQYEGKKTTYHIYIFWKKIVTSDQSDRIESEHLKENKDAPKPQKNNTELKEETVKREVHLEPTVKKEAVKSPNEKISTKSIDEKKIIPKEAAKKKENKFSGFYQKLRNKISDIYNKIKCTIQKICDKMKSLTETKEKVQIFIEDEIHKKAFYKLLREIKRLFRFLKPQKLLANIHFGFEDPYVTGQVLAGAAILYPFTEDHLELQPDFEQAILEGDIFIKGRIRLIYFVIVGLQLFLNKNIRRTYKDARKFMKQ